MIGLLDDTPQGVLMDPRQAMILQTGLGLMAASGPSRTPVRFGQALGQAGMQGMQAAQQAIQMQKMNALANLQMLQVKKEIEKQDALKALFSPSAPKTPLPQLALAEGAKAGDIGPTVTNAARLTAMQSNPVLSSGYQPIPVDKLAAAAGSGVNIEPFLKLNAEARPDLHFQDTGSEIRVIDKRTMKTVDVIKKGAAPGTIPFEASDQTPGDYRGFKLNLANAGAARQVTNVNSFVPASEEAQREFMKSTRTNYDALRSAPTALKNIEEAKALIPAAKGFMGPGGEALLEAAKFLNNRIGTSINTEGVKSAEELRSRVFVGVMENLKKMDAQPSTYQQKVMEDALGKIGTDPTALPAVLDVFGDIIRDKVGIHNREVVGAVARGVKFPYDPVIKLEPKADQPEVPQAGAPKVRRYNPKTQRIE